MLNGEKVFRCPHAIDRAYDEIIGSYMAYQKLGILPYGLRDINDAPAWLTESFITIETTIAEAQSAMDQKQLQELKALKAQAKKQGALR